MEPKRVPAADTAGIPDESTSALEPKCTHAGRPSYAFLTRRVFAIDVEKCAKCGSANTEITFVTAKDEIELRLHEWPAQLWLPKSAFGSANGSVLGRG